MKSNGKREGGSKKKSKGGEEKRNPHPPPPPAAAGDPPSSSALALVGKDGGGGGVEWRQEFDEVVRAVDALGVRGDVATDPLNILARLPEALGMETEEGSSPSLEASLRAMVQRACGVANAVVLSSSAGGEGGRATPGEKSKIRRALETLHYVGQALGAATMAWQITATNRGGDDENGAVAAVDDSDLVAGIARFSAPDPEEANRVQQLLLYLLNTAQVRGYRRRHGEMYRRVNAPGPYACYDTHAWERVCDMQEFVYEACRKEINYDMWLNLTCFRSNVSSAIDHLESCRDVQLPELHRDRHVFAFSDGIYLAAQDRFCAYGSPEHAALASDLVAAKYFPIPSHQGIDIGCDDEGWYKDILTPHLQSILDYQGMGEDVSRWMYAMIGRLIYEVNELDGWQVLPFLKGAASSGKSTILTRVCRGLYEATDVGTLSNNIERKFGLSALHDKLLFIGPEIKSDIALEQAEFQSIVSGETVQVAIKCRTAQTVEWKVPGALAGNEVPNWVDNSGSVNRRIVLFDFPNRVHNGDMELGRKIDREMPSLIVKCNRAYLSAVRRYAKDNVWKHLPAPFHAAKEEFTESVNSIVSFLRSGQLAFDKDAYMPFEHFAAAYESYTHGMGLSRIKLSGDKISHPLLEAQCRVQKTATFRYPRGGSSVLTGRFVLGCDLASSRGGMSCIVSATDVDDGLGGN